MVDHLQNSLKHCFQFIFENVLDSLPKLRKNSVPHFEIPTTTTLVDCFILIQGFRYQKLAPQKSAFLLALLSMKSKLKGNWLHDSNSVQYERVISSV